MSVKPCLVCVASDAFFGVWESGFSPPEETSLSPVFRWMHRSCTDFLCVLKLSRWFVPTQFSHLKTLYKGVITEEGAMSRSRSFNRFHHYVAWQKRRGLRSFLPQLQMDFEYYGVAHRSQPRHAQQAEMT